MSALTTCKQSINQLLCSLFVGPSKHAIALGENLAADAGKIGASRKFVCVADVQLSSLGLYNGALPADELLLLEMMEGHSSAQDLRRRASCLSAGGKACKQQGVPGNYLTQKASLLQGCEGPGSSSLTPVCLTGGGQLAAAKGSQHEPLRTRQAAGSRVHFLGRRLDAVRGPEQLPLCERVLGSGLARHLL